MNDRTILCADAECKFMVAAANRGSLKVYIVSGDTYIGRDTDTVHNDIPLEGKYISRKQGMFFIADHEFFYTNLSRSDCMEYNGLGLKENEKVRLRDGDVLNIKESYRRGAGEVTTLYIKEITGKPPVWKAYDIAAFGKNKITVGRDEKADITISDPLVSRLHCYISMTDGGLIISDNGSLNKIKLNGDIEITENYLYDCDCITMGSSVMIYMNGCIYVSANKYAAAQDSLKYQRPPVNGIPMRIDIDQRIAVNKGKQITLLKDIHVTVRGGEMVLILGGSGAGKTTFMNAVMGYEKADGQIVYGDTDIYSEFETMKSKIGFVPQQDLLRFGDTVYDTLRNAAEMKLRNIDRHERGARIDKVMDTLGLSREKDSLVSKLSGGQRKRLSIAVEYIADPQLFFLDEPDSGLDGIMARLLMENLRAIADEGKMVMVISHAADRAASYFDKVIVLAKSQADNIGHLAFFGNVPQAFEFFDTDSLEGVVKRINRVDEGGDGKADFYIDKFKIEGNG